MKRSLLVLVFIAGCKPAAPPAPVVHTDEKGLRELVDLPGSPSQVAWCEQARGGAESRVPGPTDWELQALVTFPAPQRAQIGAVVRARPIVMKLAAPAKSCLPKADIAAHAPLFVSDGRDVSGLLHSPLSLGMAAWDGTSGTMFVVAHTM